MARTQTKSRRKSTGGRYRTNRGKRKFELASIPTQSKVGAAAKVKSKRIIGGNQKNITLTAQEVSVSDAKGKTSKTTMVNVLENPANPNLVGRNILTKGSVVETKLGKARITSRPGQEGTINGILLK